MLHFARCIEQDGEQNDQVKYQPQRNGQLSQIHERIVQNESHLIPKIFEGFHKCSGKKRLF
jgi:hypothetical protein